jgi:serine/threonine-protein kinase
MLMGHAPFQSASPRELLNMQCTADPPELDDEARRTMPRGVEDLLFDLLSKAPDARPASADDVVKRLDAFKPAERTSRTTGMGRPRTSSTPKAPVESSSEEEAPRDASGPRSRNGDTMHSTPPPPPKPRADTVALVERATTPKHIPTSLALLLIVALSLVAGFSVYIIRLRTGGPSEAPTPTAGTKP